MKVYGMKQLCRFPLNPDEEVIKMWSDDSYLYVYTTLNRIFCLNKQDEMFLVLDNIPVVQELSPDGK